MKAGGGHGTLRVLVTSAGGKAPLLRAMRDAARRIDPDAKVIAGDVDPQAPARYVADGFWGMPRTEDAALPELLTRCVADGISAVLPTRDAELPFWARHRERLGQAGIAVLVSAPDAVERCLDKLAFARFGRETGLPTIETAATPDAVGAGPYVVKERFGAGSRGIGLELQLEAARAHAAGLQSPVFQPFVQGLEISIDGWVGQDGKAAGVVLRSRDRVVAGESQVTTTFRDAALESLAARAFESLGIRGPAVMQAILAGGQAHLIECNPRFGGASTMAIAAGLDTLYWSLLEATGRGVRPAFRRAAGEVRQVRLPADIILHGPGF